MKNNVLLIVLLISLLSQTTIVGQAFKKELDKKYEVYYSQMNSMYEELNKIDSLILTKSPVDSVKVKSLYVKSIRLSQELLKENMVELIVYDKKLSMVEQMYLERTQEKAKKSVDALILQIEGSIDRIRNHN